MNELRRLVFFGLMLFYFGFHLFTTSAWAQSDGYWEGATNQDNTVHFTVSGTNVHDFGITIYSLQCGHVTNTIPSIPISTNTFSYTSPTLDVTGTFINETTCTGTWDFHEATFFCYESGTWTANLTADPYIILSPSSQDFGNQQISTASVTVPFSLKNEGLGTATGSVNLTGTNADQFEITSGSGNFSLTYDQTKIIYVRFAPTSIGSKTGYLSASTVSPSTNRITSLFGTGFANSPDFEWKLTASDGTVSDNLGLLVSISGNFAIVGAILDDDNGSDSGSAYIYERTGSGWVQQAKLTASDGASSDYFGRVSISEDYAIVGAHGDDDNGSSSGSAYIFEKPVGGWTDMTETAKLTASDGVSGDYFGYSVGISGDYAIVGAHQDDDNGYGTGSAYIFEKPVGGWTDMTETAKLTASDGVSGDYFGYSVGISGDYAIIGAYGDDTNGSDAGSAYIFERTGSGWVQQAKLLSSDRSYTDYFGCSVSMSGDYAIVGSYQDDDNGSSSGSAYIFEKPVGGWTDMTETAKLTASDGASGDYFGYSVGISGDYAIIGAYLDDDNGSSSGSVYIFEKPVGGWIDMTEKTKYTPSDGASSDYFGRSVSISGNYATVGSHQDDDNGIDSGSAYVYKIAEFNSDVDHFELTSIDPPPPQTVCVPFSVTVEAKNSDNETIPFYDDTCVISGVGDNGSASVQPMNITFANGVWTGYVEICSIDTNVELTVDDGVGHTGTSNPFDIFAGPVEYFTFSSISSPQVLGTPFSITLTARDTYGYTVTDFTGLLSLGGYFDFGSPSFVEDFEDGNYDGWTDGSSSYTRLVTADTAAVGTYSFTLIGGGTGGVSYTFAQPQAPENITFYVRSSSTALSDGYFMLGRYLSCPIFFFMKDNGVMYANADTSFTYSANTWYKVQFFIDWAAEEFDLYVDDSPVSTGIAFRDSVSSFSTMFLYNYDNSQAWWDEIVFYASSKTPVSITPTTTTEFISGTWTGDLTVHEASDEMFIIGDDGGGHTVISESFSVVQGTDTDDDGIQDYVEASGCTDPNDADTDDDGIIDGVEDANQNGVKDAGETDPCNIDTDGDGIQDGTESGVTEPVADPDGEGPLLGTDTAIFIPDADPSTTTAPLNPDTDGDGMLDGEEDKNFNGRVDPGEISPNNFAGDVDGDSDADLADAVLALQVMAGIEPSVTVHKEADVNGDGKIGMEEVIYILQKVSGLR